MSTGLLLTILIVGFIGSFFSGLLGIGGAIINYPLLLFVPKALGFEGFSAYEVSGIVAIQVLFSTSTGVFFYRKYGFIDNKLIGVMGTSSIIGSFIGGYFSHLLTDDIINIVYGCLALLAVILIINPQKSDFEGQYQYKWFLTISFSIAVGVGAGVVGAGGAFLLVPIMITVLKIPTRITIATSLGVTFLSSVGTTSGKIITGSIPLLPAVIIIVSSLIASPIGVKLSRIINTSYLKLLLAILILITSIKIWFDILY